MERLAPPSPLAGGAHPEETIDAAELRSLRAAAKQGELLPQREVLEREVSAGSERRTQRAQESEYEGHYPPSLARRWAIVQSFGQDFGKGQVPIGYPRLTSRRIEFCPTTPTRLLAQQALEGYCNRAGGVSPRHARATASPPR